MGQVTCRRRWGRQDFQAGTSDPKGSGFLGRHVIQASAVEVLVQEQPSLASSRNPPEKRCLSQATSIVVSSPAGFKATLCLFPGDVNL